MLNVLVAESLSASSAKSTVICLTFIVLLALGVRILAAQFIGESRVPWNYEYEEIANNLVAGGGYAYSFYGLTPVRPTSFLPPVYPLFLALARKWTSQGDQTVKIIQIALSCLTVVSLYALARELGGSKTVAVIAALLMAIYPPVAAYAVDISTVTFETLFVITGTWLVVRAAHCDSVGLAFGSGVLLSLAALTRSTWTVLVLLALVWLVTCGRGSLLARSKQVALILLAVAITFAPWVWYNHTAHGEWVLTSTNGGLNFWIGNNPRATGEYIFPMSLDQQMVASVADWPEVARDRFFYARGLEFVRTSPAQFLELTGRKLLYFVFFRPDIGSNYKQAGLPLELARWLFVVAWLALVPFALVGLTKIGTHWREHSWLAAIFATQAVISSLYFAGTRFRTPIDGFAMIWAAGGISFLADRWQRRGVNRGAQ